MNELYHQLFRDNCHNSKQTRQIFQNSKEDWSVIAKYFDLLGESCGQIYSVVLHVTFDVHLLLKTYLFLVKAVVWMHIVAQFFLVNSFGKAVCPSHLKTNLLLLEYYYELRTAVEGKQACPSLTPNPCDNRTSQQNECRYPIIHYQIRLGCQGCCSKYCTSTRRSLVWIRCEFPSLFA